MKLYEIGYAKYTEEPYMEECDDGDYILFTDHKAAIKQAVAAEREACAALAYGTSAYKAIRAGGNNAVD